jgi:KDO2-lipid IV(A) lauroyltransferase
MKNGGLRDMKRFWQRMEALGLRVFFNIVGSIGIERASWLGGRVLTWIGPRLSRHKMVVRNLEIAFPEQDAAWHQRTARAMWGDFGRSLAEYAYLPELASVDADQRIEVIDYAGIDVIRREGRPVVFVAAHLGNWNVPAIVGRMIKLRLSVLFRRRENPYLEAVIEHWRNQMPCGFIDVGRRASKAMLDELRQGHAIGLFIDRRSRYGEPVPFFGRETPTPTIAARLALKTGAAYVPARIERLANVRFRITLHPPITPEAGTDDERIAARQMTAAANRLFEGWISAHPEQWLSTTRRWPKGTEPRLSAAEMDAAA